MENRGGKNAVSRLLQRLHGMQDRLHTHVSGAIFDLRTLSCGRAVLRLPC